MISRLFIIGGLALLTVALAAPAQAHPSRQYGQCVRKCRHDMRDCLSGTHDQVRSCRDTNCATEIQAVKDSCADAQGSDESDATDETSTDCSAAQQAAHDCLQKCRDTLKSMILTCRDGVATCISACQ
jgi:hypothetical protein